MALDYRHPFKKRTAGRIYTDRDQYYSEVYGQLVYSKLIKEEQIKNDEDLKKFLSGSTKTDGSKLFEQLRKTEYHREVINRNLGKNNEWVLRNKKIVQIEKGFSKGLEVTYYKSVWIFGKQSRFRFRDARTGKFIRISG